MFESFYQMRYFVKFIIRRKFESALFGTWKVLRKENREEK